jgi:hypothetical protein
MAHAFFPERLSNHCQGLRLTFSNICTKFDAVPLSDPSQKSAHPPHEILYSDSLRFASTTPIVPSHHYNYCTDVSTGPGNYGHQCN